MVLTENRLGRSWCCSGKPSCPRGCGAPASSDHSSDSSEWTPWLSGPVSVAGKIQLLFTCFNKTAAVAMRSQPQICWESCQAWEKSLQ